MKRARRAELRKAVRMYCAALISAMEDNGDGGYELASTNEEYRFVADEYQRIAGTIERTARST